MVQGEVYGLFLQAEIVMNSDSKPVWHVWGFRV